MSESPRYRFAPSPTGFFHVGGARTALYNWALTLRTGGTFVLRIEDTDESRNSPQWTQGIIDAMSWLGIDATHGQFEGPYFQSANADKHVAAAHQLYAQGAAYWCDMTPEQIQQRAKETGKQGYDGYSRDRGLESAPGNVLRFRVPEGVTVVHDLVRGDVEFSNDTIADFVLLRGNGTPMFLLANVVDDIDMRITHVVRAEEHLPNTPKQQLIWSALGKTSPIWAHVPVLVNEQRKKLSKRRDKVALEQYRDEGILADAMVNYLMTLGWAPAGDNEIVPWSQMVEEFRLENVNHSPAFFDVKKMTAFNGEYIRALSPESFVSACAPFLKDGPWPVHQFDASVFEQVAPLVQTRVATLSEVPTMIDFFFLDEPVMDDAAWNKTMVADFARDVVVDFCAAAAGMDWTHEVLKEHLETWSTERELKLGKTQAPIRVAVTGRTVGPPLFESIEILGREETIKRLTTALSRMG
jgi:glutamyl-tRNA synthetase